MLIRSLEVFGVPSQLLEVWENTLSSTLLPIQAEAVVQHGVLAGENLIVQAPTSAGKTFIGEMAASRAAMAGRRALYLAPTKALAEEKYAHFQALYGPLGLRVVISTRDRRTHDRQLSRGEFDFAVMVPEKLRALWVRSGISLSGLGLVVVDELQMLSDPQRGPCLEVLLSELRQTPGIQLVGLSACLGASPQLADYLHAGWLDSRERPVELRQGVLVDGQFRYREYNSKYEAREDFPELRDAGGEMVVCLARYFADLAEPTLVFVRDRASAIAMAWKLARERGLESDSLEESQPDQDHTVVREQLMRLRPTGVAFHSTDLQFEDRQMVEAAFRQGEIMVLCATPTLALGVNLPARNVIIDPWTWRSNGPGTSPSLYPISRAEYENRAGRAGRLGWGNFGRAILPADSALVESALRQRYLDGELAPTSPALDELEPREALLQLLAAANPHRQTDLQTAHVRTFSAYCAGESVLSVRLAQAAAECEGQQLLSRIPGTGRYLPTALGRVAAAAGVSFSTFTWLEAWAHNLVAPTELEAIYLSALTVEAAANWVPPLVAPRGVDFLRQLQVKAEEEDQRGALLSNLVVTSSWDHSHRQQAARQTMALWRWISAASTQDLETDLRLPIARLEALGETVGWLVETLASLGREIGWLPVDCQRLEILAERLALGLPENCLILGRQRLAGLGRDAVRKLVGQGIVDPVEAMEYIAKSTAQSLDQPAICERTVINQPVARATSTDKSARQKPPTALIIDDGRPDEVLFFGQRVDLRPAEYRLLRTLAETPGRCVRYEALYDRMWDGDQFVEPGQIYSHRSRLSAKLAEAVPERDVRHILVTVPRHGLRLDLHPEEVLVAS